MDWIETPQSSNVKRYRYDAEEQTLTVEFNHGGTYRYFGVPPETFASLRAAVSVGRAFAKIKAAHRWERVETDR